jgi:hypothetical protein
MKERHFRDFLTKIALSNGITDPFPKQSFTPYKYYVGHGNNSQIVRACLKTRFWWQLGDFEDWNSFNFIWTQWKSNKILEGFKTYNDVK